MSKARLRLTALAPLASLTLATSLVAGAEEVQRHHGPHEHGAAELHVVVEGSTLLIELHAPAMNLVGFEHQAHDEAQRRAVAEAEEKLERAEDIFVLTPQAGCRPVHAHAEVEALGHEHEHEHDAKHDEQEHAEKEHEHEHDAKDADHEDEEHGEEAHSELHAEYELECASADELTEIRTRLFELYPGIERIDAAVIGPGGQGAARMTAGSPVVAVPR